MTATFDRAPPAGLRDLLSPGGWLAPVLAPRPVRTPSGPLPTQVQFRPNGEAMVYCGSARLLKLSVDGQRVTFSADEFYERQAAGRALFRTWTVGAPGLPAALDAWFAGAKPSRTQVCGEGRVQALWHALDAPWRTVDHEAGLQYPSTTVRLEALQFDAVDAATDQVRRHAVSARPRAWSPDLPEPRDKNTRDQLAVDPDGALVVIELKRGDASKRQSVYYAPLQLLRYLHEDAAHRSTLLTGLQDVIDAKVALGLLPDDLPRLSGAVRPVVAWGDQPPSAEVTRRTAVVVDLVQTHLPPDTAPMELWHLPDGRPARLA